VGHHAHQHGPVALAPTAVAQRACSVLTVAHSMPLAALLGSSGTAIVQLGSSTGPVHTHRWRGGTAQYTIKSLLPFAPLLAVGAPLGLQGSEPIRLHALQHHSSVMYP
jgi:hypothetical protein